MFLLSKKKTKRKDKANYPTFNDQLGNDDKDKKKCKVY